MVFIENTLGVLLLVAFCGIISYWEYKRYRTLITPFGMMAWPYAAIVAMINFGGVHFGFFPVSIKSICFVIIGLIFFIIGGVVVNILFKDRVFINRESPNGNYFFQIFEYRKIFIFIAIISIIAGFIHFKNAITEVGWTGIASPKFQDAYGKGFLAHVVLFGRPSFYFLFADNLKKKRLYKIIILFLLFIEVILLQIKYHIAVLLIGAIFFSYLLGLIKFNLKKILIYSAAVYFLFNLSYVIGFSRIGVAQAYSSKIQTFLLNHFFTYLFGGPIGFSEILDFTLCPLYTYKEVFAVPINLGKFVLGDSNLVNVIIHHWIPVSHNVRYFHSSNVFGFFGVLYYFIGTYATFLICFFFGFVIRCIYFLTKFSKYIGYMFLYSYLSAFLVLSFFNYFFCIIDVFELMFYFLIFPQIGILTKKLNAGLSSTSSI